MNDKPRQPTTTPDLERLDPELLADLKQQVQDGLITQAEADRLAKRIRGKR